MKKLSAALSLLLIGCGDKLEDPLHPTGSQSISTSSDYSALYIANTAENTVTRLPVDGTPVELTLAGEPARVARTPDHVFVSLRASRAIAVLDDDGTSLVPNSTIPTGAEPFGMVTDEAGAHLYVAASLEGKVYEYDVATGAELRSWEVTDEPRWLALHPSNILYVASAYRGTFSWINLDNGKLKTGRLPAVMQTSAELADEVELDRRITGDPAISPDGEYLAIPSMYFDTTTPVIEPDSATPIAPSNSPREPSGGGYGGGSTARFNPVVAMVQVEGDGEPHLEGAELVRLMPVNLSQIQGYPASVTISPDGVTTYATIEGGRGVAAFPTRRADDSFDNSVLSNAFDALGGAGFSARTVIAQQTDMGPRGMTFTTQDEAFVYSFLDQTVQQVDVESYNTKIFEQAEQNQNERIVNFLPDLPSATTGRAQVISQVQLDAELEHGRRLFYSTDDSKMSSGAIGLSCATCHFDGRADGLTWMFDRGPRQTPSLAGKVSLTEPVRWGGERTSVADDVRQTSQGLMGGTNISEADIAAVAAFVDASRDVDSPLKGSTDPRIAAGKAIFERGDVGCVACHNGPRMTNNQKYDMFGFSGVDTRSLIGIAGSPPYLHDGSAKTLRELLERVRSGEMGNTSSLNAEEMDQLEAYLKSL